MCAHGDADDCNDADNTVFPGAPETCNGIDDDCDGSNDEDFTDLTDVCTSGLGECEEFGTTVCTADGFATECNAIAGSPLAELCDGLDNNCDGAADEDCGACCDFNGACIDDVLPSECDGPAQIHSAGVSCEDASACAALPTVSEWGPIVMTLVLGCAIGTLTYRRRKQIAA